MPNKRQPQNSISSLCFVINNNKTSAHELANKLQAIAEAQAIKVKTTTDYPIPERFLEQQDMCCVIGGDGTLLSVLRQATHYQVPTLGVNQGKLGFLATFSAFEAERRFSTLLKGSYNVLHCALLCCKTAAGDERLALNDVVLKHLPDAQLSSFDVFTGNERITEYYCDGLIFSTPTGSTAYNLSAGGPIIFPNVNVIAMTPICPHTMSNRSVIFSDKTRLKVTTTRPGPTPIVSIDGQRSLSNTPSLMPIEIFLSKQTFPLIQVRGYNHARVLRSKLKWG